MDHDSIISSSHIPHSEIAVPASKMHSDSPPAPLDVTPSRQSRLLKSRTAKFAGKKLSTSSLGNKLASKVTKEGQVSEKSPQNDKENARSAPYSPSPIPQTDNSGSSRIPRKPSMTLNDHTAAKYASVAHNTQLSERRRGRQNRHSSPITYYGSPANTTSSPASITPSNSVSSIYLRESSGNAYRGTAGDGAPQTDLIQRAKKRRSLQPRTPFDVENYIEHIENELQQAKDTIQSPTARKSLQYQLQTTKQENDRLKQEIADLRETFEAEVKTTIEHKTAVEVELKRKVKDLEDSLENKVSTIKDLESQYEENRLESNIIETLKATIERLENEKLSMVDENRSMSKRNEVLSELLAMSPTKSRPNFELRSPIREKRPGRPMSLIIPRVPTSPSTTPAQMPCSSASTSPSPAALVPAWSALTSTIDEFSLAEAPHRGSGGADRRRHAASGDTNSTINDEEYDSTAQDLVGADCENGSSPAPCSVPLPMSPVHGAPARHIMRRKPRKFMSGSTQLKPLLLPTFTSDPNNLSSASVLGSPKSVASHVDSRDRDVIGAYFFAADSAPQSAYDDESDLGSDDQRSSPRSFADYDIQYQTVDEVLAEHMRGQKQYDVTTQSDNSVRTYVDENLAGPGPAVSVVQGSGHDDRASLTCRCKTTESSYFLGANCQSHVASDGLNIETESDTFNLRALRDLELPEANSSLLTSPSSSNDVGRSSDVPHPLFSPIARRVPGSTAASRSTQNQQHGHQQPRLETRLDQAVLSPIPRYAQQSTLLSPAACTNSTPTSLSSLVSEDHTSRRVGTPMSHAAACFSRSRTPLEILHRRQYGARPLAAFTIRAICTTISRCALFVKDLKTDPLSLARRVMANAWFANWTRFGRLSWWVLGLFLPQTIQKAVPEWDWDDYDGEMIAHRCCEADEAESSALVPSSSGSSSLHSMSGTIDEQQRPGWCKSIFLWGKFSVAIMLAVGGAVIKGPGEMLRDIDDRSSQHRLRNQGLHLQPLPVDELRQQTCPARTSSTRPQAQGLSARPHNDLRQDHNKQNPSIDPWFRMASGQKHQFTTSQSCSSGTSRTDGLGACTIDDTLRPPKSKKVSVTTLFNEEGSRHTSARSASDIIDQHNRLNLNIENSLDATVHETAPVSVCSLIQTPRMKTNELSYETPLQRYI